jgi:cysteine desulfurase
MLPYLKGEFGNPAGRQHAFGARAADAVETARARVAAVIGADPRDIVWTSGATESDNLALFGALAARPGRAVAPLTEHRAVLDPLETLERRGTPVTWLRVDSLGRLDLARLEAALTPDTVLVSVMHANNETGVLHPIREIGALCKTRGVLFHTDATQSFGKEPIDVEADGIDLLSASAHKLHGPKGAGILYVRRKNPRVRLEPLLHGGGHEKGLRSGTLNVPALVGFGAAAELARKVGRAEQDRIRALRDRLEQALASRSRVNGDPARRLASTSNLAFDRAAEELMRAMPDLAISSSAACTSAAARPSHVLGAMGLDEDRVRGSLRFSLGRFTTADEIDRAAALVLAALATSPR